MTIEMQPCYPACGTAREWPGPSGCRVAHPTVDYCFGDDQHHFATDECASAGKCQHPAVETRACETWCGNGDGDHVCVDPPSYSRMNPVCKWGYRGSKRECFCSFECRDAGKPLHPAPAAPVAEPGLRGLKEAREALNRGDEVEYMNTAGSWYAFSTITSAVALAIPMQFRLKPAPPPAPKLSRVREMASRFDFDGGENARSQAIAFAKEVVRDMLSSRLFVGDRSVFQSRYLEGL